LPIKILMDTLGMSNSPYGLALLYAGIGVPISTLILKSHLMSIPSEIDEAASIDGAGRFPIAFRIIMPVARPGLVSIMILQAVYVWNEFMFALTLISGQQYKTIQLVTRNFLGLYQSNYGALFAAVVISVVPIIVLFVVFQKKVVEAFASGAIKA